MVHAGDKVKELRKTKSMSRAKLAELSGVSEITIRKIEDGARNPKVETLGKIANAFDIPVDVFINEDYSKKEELLSYFRNFIEQNADIQKDMNLLGNLLGEYINSSIFTKLMTIDFDKLKDGNITLTKITGFTEDEFLNLARVINDELLKIIVNRKNNPETNREFIVTFENE